MESIYKLKSDYIQALLQNVVKSRQFIRVTAVQTSRLK